MINKTLIEKKVIQIQEEISQLKKYKTYSIDDIVKDYILHKAIERMIEIIINDAIDINQHIIVSSGKGKLPFDFKESFLLLSEIGVYPQDFAQEISKSVGLRNIIVHEYRKLDEEIFHAAIRQCYSEFTQYCRYILDYLDRLNS